ncbi:MAG: carboxypeptidase-like regulatory domain-containing protein [Deferrisomatales bacterium]|nr:carboxypeptidase-like regulatory domain-containing protein [Deferrisomatales bacterium]
MAVALAGLVLLAGLPAAAAPDSGAEDEFLVLQLRLRSHVLSDAVPALAGDGRVFLPLGEFCAAVEFPVRVDSRAATARGWFRAEAKTLELDAVEGWVRLSGEAFPTSPAEVRSEPDDLYVDTETLGRWFGLVLEVDRNELRVNLRSDQPLPLERRLEREGRRERALARRGSLEQPAFPLVGTAYDWLSWPFADLSLGARRRRDSGGGESWESSHSVLATADLLTMTGEVFASGNQDDGLSDLQLRVGRRDPSGGGLGPLGVTEFAVGDVFSPQNALVSRSVRGRGAVLSSFPLDRPDEFDRTTLRGSAPPGWEAELQRAGALLDFQVVGSDGRYEFVDVPVLFGRNDFEVVLYGPQGQERRVPYPLYVGPGLIEPGRGHLRVSVNQHEADLLEVDDGAPAAGPARGEPRLLLDWERGLGRRFSVATSLASLPIEEGQETVHHQYLGVGGRLTLGAVFATLDGVLDTSGGTALQGAAQGRMLDTNWFAEHGRFWGFQSERVEDGDPVSDRTRLRAEWAGSALLPFSVGLEADREARRSGRVSQTLSHRLSMSAGPVLVTNRLNWQRRRGGSETTEAADQSQGSLLLSTLGRGLSVRGELGYGLAPAGGLRDTAISADWSAGSLGGIRLRCGYRFTDHQTTWSLGWNRSFAAVALGLDGEVRDDGSYAAGLSATFSLGRDPVGRRWTVRSGPMAAKASAAVRVLLDRNGDGSPSPGDEPLEGVRFQVNGRTLAESVTDGRGEAFLPCLAAHRLVDIAVDEASLVDPYWVVAPQGQRVLVRPGATPVLEFLVMDTGEIEGTVYVRRDQDVRKQPRIKLQLLDADGQVTQEVASAFDGFFLFQRVPLGAYRVRADPAQLQAIGLAAGGPVPIDLSLSDPVVAGVDFVLEEAED